MTRRFIVMVDGATAEAQDAFSKFLQSTPLGFWHFFSDGWLIVDRNDTLTSAAVRDELNRLVPGYTTLVLDMEDPAKWAGFGRTESFKWLLDVWNVG